VKEASNPSVLRSIFLGEKRLYPVLEEAGAAVKEAEARLEAAVAANADKKVGATKLATALQAAQRRRAAVVAVAELRAAAKAAADAEELRPYDEAVAAADAAYLEAEKALEAAKSELQLADDPGMFGVLADVDGEETAVQEAES